MKKDLNGHWLWLPLGGMVAVFVAVRNRHKEKQKNMDSQRREHHQSWKRWVLPVLFVGGVMVTGTVAGVLVTRQYYKRHVLPSRPPVFWQIEQNDVDPSSWGQWFPDQYQSYLQGIEGGSTRYGGEKPPRKMELRPALEVLWAGYDVGPSVWEERGHPYSLDDVTRAAPHRNNKAGCLTCKAAEAPQLIKSMGLAFYDRPFPEVREEVTHPVSCSDCHDRETMGLHLTREPFIQAYVGAGGDLEKAGRQEMRTLVCAQCHVTYYMDDGTGEVKMPWQGEPNLAAVEEYYLTVSPLRSWQHAMTGAGLPKIRHPDYEFFLGSTHHAAGVSCVDCHMPFMKVGNRKITAHSFQSPLDNPTVSCGVCHRQSDDYLRERILSIQEGVQGVLTTVEEELVKGVVMLAEARELPGTDPSAIAKAQDLHLRAFLRYDWVFSTNSKGFHNSREALIILAEAMRLAKEMQLAALEAGD